MGFDLGDITKILENEDLMKTISNVKIPAGVIETLKKKGIDISEDELKKLLGNKDEKSDKKDEKSDDKKDDGLSGILEQAGKLFGKK